MEFRKFNSIDNFGTLKDDIKNNLLDLNTYWHVTEKVDGCNFHLAISPDGEMRIASRNHFLAPDENFYDIQKEVNEQLGVLVSNLKSLKKEIRIYGEYFGDGIQNRIHYGPRRFIVFKIELDGKILTRNEMNGFLGEFNSLLVKEFFQSDSLQECVNFCNENKEILNSYYTENSHLEGFVISNEANSIMVKIKGQKFLETKPFKIQKLDDNISTLHDIFLNYCTEERMSNSISHFGEFSKNKIGSIITEFINDAWNDCTKENPELFQNIDDKLRKQITSIGNRGFNFINKITSR